MSRAFRTARIVGTGMTKLGRLNKTASELMHSALDLALADAGLNYKNLNAILALPSLSDSHFMEAHFFATRIGLAFPSLLLRTLDSGGAGPVTALLEAKRMIKHEHVQCVAIVAGDAVLSMPSNQFLEKADKTCQNPVNKIPSPVIPNGYDRYAQWHINKYNVKREVLAMCPVLMSQNSLYHPYSLYKNSGQTSSYSLEQVLNSKKIGNVTNLLECARRADGGAAIIVCDQQFIAEQRKNNTIGKNVLILGGGEGGGTLYPGEKIDESDFSCELACDIAFEECQLRTSDIQWFGLYDCFPVCLIRAIEAVGLAPRGKGADYIEYWYHKLNRQLNSKNCPKNEEGLLREDLMNEFVQNFPINTHGGLLAFGAPWEVPAMYNIIEAVEQLSGTAEKARQVKNCQRALVYGNGGIFSHSSIAILGKPV